MLCENEEHASKVAAVVAALDGVELELASDRTFQLHRRGKIAVRNKVHIRTNAELAHVYTPGVGRVSMAIHDNPDAVWELTIKSNAVAIVSDGTALLGLGDIGPEAATPVMEGKSIDDLGFTASPISAVHCRARPSRLPSSCLRGDDTPEPTLDFSLPSRPR